MNPMNALKCSICGSERPYMRHKAEIRVPQAAISTRPEGPSLKNDFEIWLQAYDRRSNKTVGVELVSVGKTSVSFSIKLLKKGADSLLVTITPPATEDDSYSITAGSPLFQQRINSFAVSDIYSTTPTNPHEPVVSPKAGGGGGPGIGDRIRAVFTRTPSLESAKPGHIPHRVTLDTLMEKCVELYPEVMIAEEAKRKAASEGKSAKRAKLEPGEEDEGWGDNKEEDPWGDDGGDDGWGDGKDGDGKDEWDNSAETKVSFKIDEFQRVSKLKARWLARESVIRATSQQKSILDSPEMKISNQIFTAAEVSNMLINTLLTIMKNESSGLEVEPVNDNIYHWRVRLSHFAGSSKMHSDMAILDSKYGIDYVEFDVKFDMHLYPFYPPDVRPVWPRLENFFMGRIVCMEELLLSKWNPFRDIVDIFEAIKRLVSAYGTVNTDSPVNDPNKGLVLYTETEYQLWRLSMLTEVAPRANILYKDNELEIKAGPTKMKRTTSSDKARQFENWHTGEEKKGGGGNQSGMDSIAYASYLAAQRKKNAEILEILSAALGELSQARVSVLFLKMLEHSCIIPFLESWLTKATPVVIEKDTTMYYAIFSICRAMAAHSTLGGLFVLLKGQRRSLQSLVTELQSSVSRGKMAPKMEALIRVMMNEIDNAVRTRPKELPSETAAVAHAQPDIADFKPKGSDALVVTAPKVECPICTDMFPSTEIEQHAGRCDGTKKKSSSSSSSVVVGSPAKSNSSNSPSTSSRSVRSEIRDDGVQCPICGYGYTASEIEDHVNRCMLHEQETKDKEFASMLSDGPQTIPTPNDPPPVKTQASSSSLLTPAAKKPQPNVPDQGPLIVPILRDDEWVEGSAEKSGMFGAANECPLCLRWFNGRELVSHLERCWQCTICSRAVVRQKVSRHIKFCKERGKQDEDEMKAVHFCRKEQSLLNKMQLAAVQYVQKQAKTDSELKYASVLAKFKTLNLTEDDLRRVQRYVRNEAQMVIHVNLTSCMQFFLKDTNYRNRFETTKSNIGGRVEWEDRMFNRLYHDSSFFDRVKYGVLNIGNDPLGVTSCYGYGDSYFILDNTVRLRTTFASCDTAATTAVLATCEYYCHVLDSYTDKELTNIHLVASGKQLHSSSETSSAYKEVQIHGEVRFNRDIKALVVNPTQNAVMADIKRFAAANGFPVIMMSPKK